MMGIESLLVLLLIGAVAGWLAGRIMKGYGFGLIGNIASILHSTIGAIILLFLIGLIKRA